MFDGPNLFVDAPVLRVNLALDSKHRKKFLERLERPGSGLVNPRLGGYELVSWPSAWTSNAAFKLTGTTAARAPVSNPPRKELSTYLRLNQKYTPLLSVPNSAKTVVVVAGSDLKWKPCPVSGGVVASTAIVAEHS